jgi:hypothetical protein
MNVVVVILAIAGFVDRRQSLVMLHGRHLEHRRRNLLK